MGPKLQDPGTTKGKKVTNHQTTGEAKVSVETHPSGAILSRKVFRRHV